MTALHLFQFQGHEVVMQLVNAQLAQPSHEMAAALDVPLNCLEAVYPIPARLMDFPEMAIPAIVQRTGDIPPRSTDRLILIDVRYLYPHAPDGSAQEPTTVRNVHRIGYQVIRSHLLMVAGVFHYCHYLETGCTVTLDGVDWPSNDHSSRPVRHGSYVIIVVPPQHEVDLDTQIVAETLQDDVEHDTFMNVLLDPDQENDDPSLLQQSLVQHDPIPSRFLKESTASIFPLEIVEEMLPEFHTSNDRYRQKGAVLRPKAVLNPQPTCDAINDNDALACIADPSSTHLARKAEKDQGRKITTVPVKHNRVTGVRQKDHQQTTIEAYFRSAHSKSSRLQTEPKQTTITKFFKPIVSPHEERQVSHVKLPAHPEQAADTSVAFVDQQATQGDMTDDLQPQDRCSEQQTVPAPNFQASLPTPLPPLAQVQRHRPIWMLELTSLFEEFSATIHQETGPEMEVDVWYIHHHNMPRCDSPRIVRLDNIHELWYADISTVWFDRIVRQEPMKVLIVKPRPTHTLRSRAPVHIILEQGMSPGLVALHFTAVFQGGPREGVYQVAESVPDHISTNLMIDRHNFWTFCHERPCHMWSGILRFHPDHREEIFSGISVVLIVAEPIAFAVASSSTTLEHEQASLMQRPNAIPTTSTDVQAESLTPAAPSISEVLAPANTESHSDESLAQNIAPMISPPVPIQQAPLMRIRAMDEFRHALKWQIDTQRQLCFEETHRRLIVHTWFSDAIRMPRSDHFRDVLLGPLPMQWPFEILNRWQDFLDPEQDVTLQLVQPHPTGGSPDVVAHVIVMQAQNPTTRAALITVVELLEDPWHPTSFCTLLPTQVDEYTIIQEVGINDRCRPLNPHQVCEIMHGTIKIEGTMTFPVRHGYQFEVALSSLDDDWDEDTALIQIEFAKFQNQFRHFDRSILASLRTGIISHPSQEAATPHQAISTTIVPPVRQGTPADSFQFLTFHSVLQSAWQPLSLLSARQHDPSVTVVTWYIDHVRHPQCFVSRSVQLYQDPEEWTHLLRLAWHDVVLHDHLLHFHVVQPDPIEMEPDVALHIILVQQPIDHFDSVLISVLDSALEGLPPMRHASMAPHMIPYSTLLGIAYKDQDCRQHQNTCSAWAGDVEIMANDIVPLINGQALTVAIHRHIALAPDEPDPWESILPEVDSPSQIHPGARFVPLTHDIGCSSLADRVDQTLYQKLQDQRLSINLADVVEPRRNQVPQIETARKHRVQLCLDTVLPDHEFQQRQDLDPQTSAIASFQQSDWAQYCASFELASPAPLPEGLRIHPSSYTALLSEPLESDPLAWIWELYVDGSQGNCTAGWSVIVTCRDDTRTCFHGCYAGQVQLMPQHPQWIGAETVDNIAAELTAFIVAQDVCFRMLPNCATIIRPDLMLSQMIATFENITNASPRLAQLCRVLSRWLGKKTQVSQVPAHKGHPWNELADSVAKWAADQSPQELPIWHSQGLHELVSTPHDLQWCWLQDASDKFQCCFPPLIQQEVMQFVPSAEHTTLPDTEVAAEDQWITLAFSCVTANVLALDHFEHQNEIGRKTGARTLRIDHQFHAKGIAIAGIQEARTKQGRYRSEHYHILSAGYQGPNPVCLGCELWIHHTMTLVTLPCGTALSVSDFKLTTQWADPRRLFVRLENMELALSFVVLHVPCLGKNKGDGTRPIDDLEAWWKETSRLMRSYANTELLWILADANAPINQEFSPFTGDAGAEQLNQQGRLFGNFLTEHELFVPSTFHHFHVGHHHTWTHSNGAKYRRDYVLVPQRVFDIVVDSAVIADFDTTFCHDDHLPLCLRVHGILKRRVMSDRPFVWDEQAFLCPERNHAFRQALATLPIPVWYTSVEAHTAWFEKQIYQLGCQFFGRAQRSKNRPQLRASTLEAIAMKRHLLDCARKWNLAQTPEFKELLKPIEKQVRKAVREDLGVYYDQLLVQLQDSDCLGDLRTVFRTLLRLGGRNRKSTGSLRPLPMLRKENGTLTSTFLERQWVWMEQFAQIEAGQTMALQELTSLDQHPSRPALDIQEPGSFPSLWDIHQGIRKLKRGRAPGPNGLPPALLKAGGEVFARQFLALVTKCAAHSHEPLSWKGGRLFQLHKGKMHPSEPSGYRSIFVSDFTAKLYHMTLRSPLEQAWTQSIHSLQMGGRKGQGTDMAHHVLQTFWHWIHKKHYPAAIVFFDVRAAFYSVIREALFPGDGNLAALQDVLTALGIQDQIAENIAESVDHDFALQGVTPHMLAILKDAMVNTHFFIDGIPQPCRTRRGTRPGDPIGDILFNLVMSCLLRDAKAQPKAHPDLTWYGGQQLCADFTTANGLPSSGCFDISFVDDCAFGIHGKSNQQVELGIQAVVEAMTTASKRRGLIINFEQGKTEVLWHVVGKGSKAKKMSLAAEGSQLKWHTDQGPFALRVTHAYKHLGTWIQAGNVHGKEIQQRSSLARSTWGVLAKAFYNKPYVLLQTKAKVFQSTALSQFMYNAHVWTGVAPKEWNKWHNALRKPYGLMVKGKLRGVNPLHLDMDAVSALAGILPPKHALQVARLRYLKRLTVACPQVLWDLLIADAHTDQSWISACQDAFRWFRTHYDIAFAPASDDIQVWLPIIAL